MIKDILRALVALSWCLIIGTVAASACAGIAWAWCVHAGPWALAITITMAAIVWLSWQFTFSPIGEDEDHDDHEGQ